MCTFHCRIASWLFTIFLSTTAWSPLHAQTVPTVAAAADLKFALEEVAASFERKTGNQVRLVFGSSGNFYSQILQGAPFQMYMSADEDFVFKLADAGMTSDRGRLYARGRIGIMVPKGSPMQADSEFKDLAAAMKDGRLQKFAIANPEHAPYGARAKEALQHVGLWDAIQPMLVRFLSRAAGETRVPPEPATDHAVAFTKSICTGTPAAKNVVETQAEMRISLMTQSRVASVQRNWKISLFAASAAGITPVKPP